MSTHNTEAGYHTATTILGKDFISPERIMASELGIVYTDDQLAMFKDTLPSKETLEWCRDKGYMLVAGPNRPMSFIEISHLKSDYFCPKKNFVFLVQMSALKDKAETRWIMLCKEPVPGSTSKYVSEQCPLLSDSEEIPNAHEVVWCMTMYTVIRNILLLQNMYVRTKSFHAASGRGIIIGVRDTHCLDIGLQYFDYRDPRIGLAAVRKPG